MFQKCAMLAAAAALVLAAACERTDGQRNPDVEKKPAADADTAPTSGYVDRGISIVDGAADRTTGAVKDASITSAVKAKFLADTTVKGLNIDVDTRAGVVALNGTASSRAEADRAVMLARNTEGVSHVVDNLHVK